MMSAIPRMPSFLAVALGALVLAGCAEETPTGTQTVTDPVALEKHRAAGDELAAFAPEQTFEIVLENLSPLTGDGSSQPFSPPVIATHDPSIRMFRVGKLASDALAQIAEDAIAGPMLEALRASSHVYDVAQGGGVLFPAESARYEIRAAGGQRRLSMAFMLVNTNDGFAGVDALQLPGPSEDEIVVYLSAYDAGTERNTELKAHIPGPCCNGGGMGEDTAEPIHAHEGILGIGDLDASTWGWTDPVARLTVRRMN